MLIKDNIDTGDRMNTTAGSLAFVYSHPRFAPTARCIRSRAVTQSGALILGKDEFGASGQIFDRSHSTSDGRRGG